MGGNENESSCQQRGFDRVLDFDDTHGILRKQQALKNDRDRQRERERKMSGQKSKCIKLCDLVDTLNGMSARETERKRMISSFG